MGKWRYGVILDAGSSGTRVYIYKWLSSDIARSGADPSQLQKLPVIETSKKWTKKIHPGISTFGEDPHAVGPDHMKGLLDFALKHIPAEDIPHTPIFLLATAGMRILPQVQQKAILEEVCEYARKNTRFELPDCGLHVQVIPGETEGLYGWIAANYLLGGFDQPKDHDHGKGHHTYGFLDMGGASAQIAFAPNATEAEKHANDLTLLRLRTIGGTPLEYKVFVTTWLGFGANQARQRYVEQLLESSPKSKEYPDPCLPEGLMVDIHGTPLTSGKTAEKHLLGTGKFTECLHQTYPLLEKEKECLDMPCLINGQHVPAIDFDVNHFVGVSEYWHTTHQIFEMGHKDKAYDFKTYQNRVNEFCSQDWKGIEKSVEKHKWGKKVDAQTAQEVCFKASWLINMLHDGIGVPRVGLEELKGNTNTTKQLLDSAKSKGFLDPFQAVDKVGDVEVSWTLGKMVLYAASEIPPIDDTQALAVGFGSNEPGIPHDFQRPGGTYLPLEKGGDDSTVSLTPNPKHISTLLILILVFALVGFFTCFRDRRNSALRKFTQAFGRKPRRQRPSNPRRRSRFTTNLLNPLRSRTPSYERVLEEGLEPHDFELGPVDSSSDADYSDQDSGDNSRHQHHHRIGRTSGWATPQLKAGMGDPMAERGELIAQAAAMGLAPPPQREGLLFRTDSKERLGRGRKSRGNSPGRMKSPMGVFKESVD